MTTPPLATAADIAADPHFAARNNLAKVDDPELGEVVMPAVVPKLAGTPGRIAHAGPPIGAHNKEIYGGLLGKSDADLAALGHLGARGRESRRAHVLDRHTGTAGDQLERGFEQELLREGITDLHARALGVDAVGPLPADTAFTPHHLQHGDAVLAMFHDQGLPVLKFAGFGRGVNVTLGLPIVRTSPDHGTALDIAGQGKADARSMIAAVKMAASMADARAR